jgi:LysR family transcriptional regulator for bpeEF and oprC
MKYLYGMELFVAVAKARSFSRAAETLQIPKSTLSRQVADLEKAMGLRLLSRTTRKVELTDAGELYLSRCERIVAEAQGVHEELQHLVQIPTGPLRVNMPADFGTDFLAETFANFAQKYPAVTFHLDQASPEHAPQVFQTCDVAIEIGEPPDSSKIARRLGAIRAYLYASPEYIAACGVPAHPRELADHDCIQFRTARTGNRVVSWPMQSETERFDIHPTSRFSVNSVAMLRRLAILGVGIVPLTHQDPHEDIASGRLKRVLPDWYAGPFPVYAVTDTRLLPAKTRMFIEFLTSRLGQES